MTASCIPEPRLARRTGPWPGGLGRRDFLRLCVTATAMMGLPWRMAAQVADAARSGVKPPVVWLHFQECTGCSGSLLRSHHPSLDSLLLDLISLDYHETLMAAAGAQAEATLQATLARHCGDYLLVVEGAIPTAFNGACCQVGGQTALASLRHAAEGASAILCIGTCSSFGGLQAAEPNPTGAKPVSAIIADKPIIHIPGCPPHPHNFLATLLHYLTFRRWPELDALKRPKFAYGRKLHEHCERRPHFDAGRFAQAYGDDGHAQGYCLYKLGCKGPATYANCSVQRFNEAGVWPVSIGAPCLGCTEPTLAFRTAIADKVQIHEPTPFEAYAPAVVSAKGKGADPVTTGVAGLGLGLALGAGAMMARRLPNTPQIPPAPQPEESSHAPDEPA